MFHCEARPLHVKYPQEHRVAEGISLKITQSSVFHHLFAVNKKFANNKMKYIKNKI